MVNKKYEVILHNQEGAGFSEKFNTKKSCDSYLKSFADPESLTGEVIGNNTGEVLAIKKVTRFQWL
jgi:hypothetical protein